MTRRNKVRAVCSRSWQAEAVFDKRLDGADRASFMRHLGACPECRAAHAEVEALSAIARRLPTAEVSEFERRRSRHTLLRNADAIVTGNARERWGFVRPLAAAATVVAIAGGSAALALRSNRPATETRLAAANAATGINSAEGPARAKGATSNNPSAEAESATFNQQSAVADPAATLPAEPASPSPSSTSPSMANRALAPTLASTGSLSASADNRIGNNDRTGGGPTRGIAPTRATQTPPLAPANAASQTLPVSTPPSETAGGYNETHAVGTAGAVFDEAVEAFSRGDYALAEVELQRFERAFPADTRAEDASFLRAVCRQRLGDRAGAARSAHEYLRRFPAGFRRDEARTIRVNSE